MALFHGPLRRAFLSECKIMHTWEYQITAVGRPKAGHVARNGGEEMCIQGFGRET